MKNDMVKSVTEFRFIIYQGENKDKALKVLVWAKHLMEIAPCSTRWPGVDFETKLIDVIPEFDDVTNTYNIIGVGVFI
jgi:hypothetical protein